MGIPIQEIDTLEQYWADLKTIGSPPPLTPDLFLANREAASSRLDDLFAGNTAQLKLETHYPDQVADFVSAYVANLED